MIKQDKIKYYHQGRYLFDFSIILQSFLSQNHIPSSQLLFNHLLHYLTFLIQIYFECQVVPPTADPFLPSIHLLILIPRFLKCLWFFFPVHWQITGTQSSLLRFCELAFLMVKLLLFIFTKLLDSFLIRHSTKLFYFVLIISLLLDFELTHLFHPA